METVRILVNSVVDEVELVILSVMVVTGIHICNDGQWRRQTTKPLGTGWTERDETNGGDGVTGMMNKRPFVFSVPGVLTTAADSSTKTVANRRQL